MRLFAVLGCLAITVVLLLTPRVVGNESNETIVLTPENTIALRGEVNQASVAVWQLALVAKVAERGDKDYPIYLVVDSPGGDIYFGEQFIEFAKKYPNVKTISIFAASMASAIVEAMPGERLVTGNGILMFHRAAGQFSGQFNDGEVEQQLTLWKGIVT